MPLDSTTVNPNKRLQRLEVREKLKQSEIKEEFLSNKELYPIVNKIRKTLKKEEMNLKEKYPILKHQDLIGLGFFIGSVAVIAVTSYMFIKEQLHWGLAMISMMLAGSIIHELEHDLIHNLYFKTQQWVQHVMFFFIWFLKMNIPPWMRKVYHLRHHLVSGTTKDIEERLIGTGSPLVDPFRLLTTFSNPLLVLFMGPILKDNEFDSKQTNFTFHRIFWISLPTVGTTSVIAYIFFEYQRLIHGFTFGQYDYVNLLPMSIYPYIRIAAILVSLPNILRSLCLNLMASYSHYYGDIPDGSVYYQNQILDHWILYPLQLFCFNFGATHLLHHYVPSQTFYVRQMLYSSIKAKLLKEGIRLNDFKIALRANRYYSDATVENRYDNKSLKGH